MDLQIIKKDGTSFILSDHDIQVDDFKVGSISLESNMKTVDGRDGQIDYGATYGTRTIEVPFQLKAYDLLDYPLARDAFYALVLETESFYIRELRRPALQEYAFVDISESAVDEDGNRKFKDGSQNAFVGGKRYLVRCSGDFDVEQTLKSPRGKGTLTFETTELPFAESIGTSQDIQRNGVDADSALWGFGMGLSSEDKDLAYTHEADTFSVYNAGNVAVHPFQQDLKITISDVQGSDEFFELVNKTNGSTFRVEKQVTSSKTIELEGPRVTINSLAALRDTNRQFIELSPGRNEFEINGASSAKVAFDTRFYYK